MNQRLNSDHDLCDVVLFPYYGSLKDKQEQQELNDNNLSIIPTYQNQTCNKHNKNIASRVFLVLHY